MLNQLHRDERTALMHELFAPDEMAMNVCRTCIGASDYSKSLYSFDDSEPDDPELAKFSIDHDKAYILPALREARQLNPDLFLFSTPWSPPAWMKFNHSMLGGTIRKSDLEIYSRYFQKFLDAYKAEGVEINAITVQNEVDTTVDGRYAACLLAQEDEILFLRKYLGPLLRKIGSSTKIWVLDQNFTLWGRAIAELSDAQAYEFIDGIAWHGYAGEPSAMTQVHDAFPQKSAYFTEGGPQREPHIDGTPFPDPMTAWARWAEWANSVIRNWSRSIMMWNLALDEKGLPISVCMRRGTSYRERRPQAVGSSPSIARRARLVAADASGRLRTTRNTCAGERRFFARMELRRAPRNLPRTLSLTSDFAIPMGTMWSCSPTAAQRSGFSWCSVQAHWLSSCRQIPCILCSGRSAAHLHHQIPLPQPKSLTNGSIVVNSFAI
jgi:hypothetical protein